MNTLIAITGIGVLAMLSEIFNFRKFIQPITLIGLIVASVLSIIDWDTNVRYFNDMMYFDNYAVVFSLVLTCISFLWFYMSGDFFNGNIRQADFTAIISFSLGGAIVMISFADLIMLFLGIEILSIAMYVLAASNKTEPRSNEAGFKYFLMGAFASGFLLLGIALVYGTTGSFNLREIAAYSSANALDLPLIFYSGILMMLFGLLFKVAAAPFHFWAPDVYEGSPTVFTAYMTTVVKTAAFAALLRLFTVCFSGLEEWWGPVVAVVAAISMLLGNIMAVYQTSLKRMMAYSSVSHAGYMLMVLVAMNQYSNGALLIYTLAYSLASLGVFSLLMKMTSAANESVASLKGYAANNKLGAVTITVALFSMAGIPPVAGFFAKYYVFTGALQNDYIWLVLIAVFSSLIGVYYYFRVIMTIFQHSDHETVEYSTNLNQSVVYALVLIGTLFIGILPGFLTGLI